ncbi:MAG: hypothetical protein RIQ56_782 [Candidatus Parcubacteria bacterium]|jgi:hypothetical protein
MRPITLTLLAAGAVVVAFISGTYGFTRLTHGQFDSYTGFLIGCAILALYFYDYCLRWKDKG